MKAEIKEYWHGNNQIELSIKFDSNTERFNFISLLECNTLDNKTIIINSTLITLGVGFYNYEGYRIVDGVFLLTINFNDNEEYKNKLLNI